MSVGPPYQYDAAGNMTADASHTYTYDAENRLTKVDGGATATYVYDAVGRRVRRTVSGSNLDYLYDLAGNVVAELTGAGTWNAGYVYLAGGLVAEYASGTTYFVHNDHLGSARLLTKLDKSVLDSLDYLPYGEQVAGGSATTHKFTGDERDSESGLDHTLFRQYSSSLGRWMTPDPAGLAAVDPANPQSWNGYAYVLNNPVNLLDPLGLFTPGDPPPTPAPTPSTAPSPLQLLEQMGCALFYVSPFGTSAGWCIHGRILGESVREPRDRDRDKPQAPLGSKAINRSWSSTFSCGMSPAQLMSTVESNFFKFADYTPSANGPNAVFSPGAIGLGQTVLIDTSYGFGGYAVGQTNAVTVSAVTSTSFTFTVVPGQHFMAPGSTVSFNVGGGNGSLTFTVAANGRTANAFYSLTDVLGGHSAESATWSNLEANIASSCKQ